MWWVDVGTANARGCASQPLLNLISGQLPQLGDGVMWTTRPHSHVKKEVEERERDSEYQTVEHLVPEFRTRFVLSHSVSGGCGALWGNDLE
jgi:hypothetical protein